MMKNDGRAKRCSKCADACLRNQIIVNRGTVCSSGLYPSLACRMFVP